MALSAGHGSAAPGWKHNLTAVRKALQHELLMPLRALNECDLTSTMAGGAGSHYPLLPHVLINSTYAAVVPVMHHLQSPLQFPPPFLRCASALKLSCRQAGESN